MIFNCGQIIEWLSKDRTLLPGTAILTGTPQGVGYARNPPVYLQPGDTVEVEIEKIGVLKNSVTNPPPADATAIAAVGGLIASGGAASSSASSSVSSLFVMGGCFAAGLLVGMSLQRSRP
jgi:hypothetical protein